MEKHCLGENPKLQRTGETSTGETHGKHFEGSCKIGYGVVEWSYVLNTPWKGPTLGPDV